MMFPFRSFSSAFFPSRISTPAFVALDIEVFIPRTKSPTWYFSSTPAPRLSLPAFKLLLIASTPQTPVVKKQNVIQH